MSLGHYIAFGTPGRTVKEYRTCRHGGAIAIIPPERSAGPDHKSCSLALLAMAPLQCHEGCRLLAMPQCLLMLLCLWSWLWSQQATKLSLLHLAGYRREHLCSASRETLQRKLSLIVLLCSLHIPKGCFAHQGVMEASHSSHGLSTAHVQTSLCQDHCPLRTLLHLPCCAQPWPCLLAVL